MKDRIRGIVNEIARSVAVEFVAAKRYTSDSRYLLRVARELKRVLRMEMCRECDRDRSECAVDCPIGEALLKVRGL